MKSMYIIPVNLLDASTRALLTRIMQEDTGQQMDDVEQEHVHEGWEYKNTKTK
jgi:hypothetical protein